MKHSTANHTTMETNGGYGTEREDQSSSAMASTGAFENTHQPIFNVYPKGEAWMIEVFMPGVPKEGVKMEILGNTLTLYGKKGAYAGGCGCGGSAGEGKAQGGIEGGRKGEWKPLHQEINCADYEMQWELGSDIDPERIEAQMEDGVLYIHLPKHPAAKSKVVPVK